MGLDSRRMSSRSIARWSLRTGLQGRPSSTAILLASPCLRLLILGIIGLCGQVCDARTAAPGVPGRAADHPRRRDLRGELAAGGAELRLLCAPNNRPVCSGLACRGGSVSWSSLWPLTATDGCACRWWRQATRARARSARSRRAGTGRTPSCSLAGTSRSEPAGSGRGANLRSPAATSKWNLPFSQHHPGC